MKIAYRNTVRDQLAFAAYHFPRSPMMLFMIIGFLLLINYSSVIPGIPKDKSVAFQIFLSLFLRGGVGVFCCRVLHCHRFGWYYFQEEQAAGGRADGHFWRG